jgi:integrase/recombinase XerD
MLEELFPRAHARYSSLPIVGGVLEDLCQWLHSLGYPGAACRRRVAAAPLLDRLLSSQGVRSLRDCTASILTSSVPKPRKWTAHMAHALGRSLRQYLEEVGRLSPAPITASGELVKAYRTYLETVRGLAESTTERHASIALEFLQFLESDDRLQSLGDLGSTDIDAFLTKAGQRLGRASMQKIAAVMRVFLRFLGGEERVPLGLAAHIDSPRQYRGERLSRALPWDAVLALLDSIDRSTPKGRRDYAMLLLIATYGLRRGEVAALNLGDIAWRAKQIRVPRSKVGSPLLLPLTDQIATALMDYLRHGRPDSPHRSLFLRVRVPCTPIEATAVTDVFYTWAAVAGVRVPNLGGPHCLRHSLAVHLLRQGAPLKTIGDLLGHRSPESTCVYLRLNVDDLRDVALPLPVGQEEQS